MIAIDQSGSGEPIVLIHGLGANRSVWTRVAPVLAERRVVLAPDIPGFGESDPIGEGFDLRAVAGALAEPLAERAGSRFDLVGNSLGGAVAIQLAYLRPQLVRRLILCAPAGFSPAPWPLAAVAGRLIEPALAFRRLLGAPLADLPAARRLLLWGAIAEPDRLPADDAARMLLASRGSARIGAALVTVLRDDLRASARLVEAPVGLLWGTRDRVVPISTLRAIHRIRPEAPVATVPRAAHVPQLERPTEFIRALERLLERLSGQPARNNFVRSDTYKVIRILHLDAVA